MFEFCLTLTDGRSSFPYACCVLMNVIKFVLVQKVLTFFLGKNFLYENGCGSEGFGVFLGKNF